MVCPNCGSVEAYEWIYTNMIWTPFGIKLIMRDAAERFPEILKWWERRYDLTEEEKAKFGFL